MSEDTFVVNLKRSKGKKPLRAKTVWRCDGGCSGLVVALDGDEAYRFVLSEEDVQKMKSESSNSDSFDSWLEEAFKEGSERFTFALEAEKRRLRWQMVGGTGFRLTLGEIRLEAADVREATDDMFDASASVIRGLKADAVRRSKEADGLKENLRECHAMLAEFKDEKLSLEQKLFEQFVPVLNSKKEKIRELMKEGRSALGDGPDVATGGGHAMSDSDEDDFVAASGSKQMSTSVDSQNFLDDLS